MSIRDGSRRAFLIQSLAGVGGAWVASNIVGILETEDYLLHAAQAGRAPALQFFTAAQAAEVEAMASQIIPTDSTPGAREAKVINFIDRALMTFEQDQQDAYRKGLGELLAASQKDVPGATSFAALTSEQQIKVLTAIERTPFFELVRTHTVTGFFANPVHGGNQGKVGWKLLSYDDSLKHTPPFGYYDAQPLPRR